MKTHQAPMQGRRAMVPARRGSMHVAAWQRQRLGHTDRVRLMDAARRRERETRQPGSGRHGGELLQTGLRVLHALLYRGWGRAGACDPGLAQLAQATALARSTVQAAIDRLEAAGILLRVRRGLVIGGRWTQVTNVYLFRAPAAWPRPSDTDSRSALKSEDKNREEAVLWEGAGSAEPPDPTWLAAALQRWGLQEAPAAVG
ncbi:hypothetical protein BKE38_01935 [Pseudoroseomonas deserti]|uniref:Helix-turn-helix domain-containing protein n=1 Tax=Teichococcus deserti TaxID=1817963 RepID=A0A1V2H7Q6_9PROT|nr:hypothetical protein [Pseudoroseomonas deserti]ONG58816.1 hypothetical protein BKE38_01935 [Pseudoroseomonas deserti]